MSDTVFRAAPPVTEPETLATPPEPAPQSDSLPEAEIAELKDSDQAVLQALGISDEVHHLPEADQQNLNEVKSLIEEIITQKGLKPNLDSFSNTLDALKWDMGLDPNAEPSVVLDRIAGVVKAWKSLSFLSNPNEKRSLFMKLAKAQSSSEMNKIVFQTMEGHKVWQ